MNSFQLLYVFRNRFLLANGGMHQAIKKNVVSLSSPDLVENCVRTFSNDWFASPFSKHLVHPCARCFGYAKLLIGLAFPRRFIALSSPWRVKYGRFC